MNCMLWEQVFLLALGHDLRLRTLIISLYDSHVPNLHNYQFSWDSSYELICCDNQPPFDGNLPLTRCLKGLSHVCLSLCAIGIVLCYKVLLPILYQTQVSAKGTKSDFGNTCYEEGRRKLHQKKNKDVSVTSLTDLKSVMKEEDLWLKVATKQGTRFYVPEKKEKRIARP